MPCTWSPNTVYLEPRMSCTCPSAGPCCPSAVTGTGTRLCPGSTRSSAHGTDVQLLGEQTQTGAGQAKGGTCAFSQKYPQQSPGEGRSDRNCFASLGTAVSSGSRALRGLSCVFCTDSLFRVLGLSLPLSQSRAVNQLSLNKLTHLKHSPCTKRVKQPREPLPNWISW